MVLLPAKFWAQSMLFVPLAGQEFQSFSDAQCRNRLRSFSSHGTCHPIHPADPYGPSEYANCINATAGYYGRTSTLHKCNQWVNELEIQLERADGSCVMVLPSFYARFDCSQPLLTLQATFQARIHNQEFASTPAPPILILPTSSQHVADAVRCYTASEINTTSFLVRGGGHSYTGYSYISSNGGPFILVDLQYMNSVSVNVQTNEAVVGGGVTLGGIYAAIDAATPATSGF
ncbi:hypothetical protein HDU91_007401, partial [Kappamyces sp. JEL0680]